jgi:hypothetical protein
VTYRLGLLAILPLCIHGCGLTFDTSAPAKASNEHWATCWAVVPTSKESPLGPSKATPEHLGSAYSNPVDLGGHNKNRHAGVGGPVFGLHC